MENNIEFSESTPFGDNEFSSNHSTFSSSFALDTEMDAEDDDPTQYPWVKVTLIVLYSLVFATCFSGNVLVVLVIGFHHRMRTITNFFLANLAVTDLFVGVFCVLPNLSTYLSPYWTLGRVMCKLYYFVQSVSYTASVCILVVISLERYVAIIHPIRSRQLQTMCLLRTTVTSVWTVAACSGVPYLVIYDTVRVPSSSVNGGTVQFCVLVGNYDLNAYTVTSFVLWYVVPLVMMTYVYCRISVVLWRSTHNAALSSSTGGGGGGGGGGAGAAGRGGSCGGYEQLSLSQRRAVAGAGASAAETPSNDAQQENGSYSPDSDSDSRWPSSSTGQRGRRSRGGGGGDARGAAEASGSGSSGPCTGGGPKKSVAFRMPILKGSGNALNSRRKVIRVLMVLVASFALCVLPYHVRVLWQDFNRSHLSVRFWHRLITPLTFVVYYLNSALNPILYAFLSDKFRSSFLDFSRCRKGRRSPGGASITMRTGNSPVETQERKLSQTIASVSTLR